MPRVHSKTKEDREHKERKAPKKKKDHKKSIQRFWSKHWEVIIAAIAGLIVGAFIVPRFFR
jgi:hypothetical protein